MGFRKRVLRLFAREDRKKKEACPQREKGDWGSGSQSKGDHEGSKRVTSRGGEKEIPPSVYPLRIKRLGRKKARGGGKKTKSPKLEI